MSRPNPKASLAMKAAWEMARKGQASYGGPIRQYIREALRLAWVDVKAYPVTTAVDALLADLRAARSNPAPKAPTPHIGRFMGRTPNRRIWAGSRL